MRGRAEEYHIIVPIDLCLWWWGRVEDIKNAFHQEDCLTSTMTVALEKSDRGWWDWDGMKAGGTDDGGNVALSLSLPIALFILWHLSFFLLRDSHSTIHCLFSPFPFLDATYMKTINIEVVAAVSSSLEESLQRIVTSQKRLRASFLTGPWLARLLPAHHIIIN